MKTLDEDALLCDMAETYRIYDPESLPVLVYARLATGLRNDSRIKMKMSGFQQPINTLLLALLFDKLTNLFRGKEDEPSKLFEILQSNANVKQKTKNGRMIFATPEDFERAWEGE